MNQPPPQMVSVSRLESGIALVTIDMPGSSANVLTSEMFSQLDQTFAELAEQPDWQGMILYSAKPRIFMAGADLKAINRTWQWPTEKIIEFCQDGIRIMRQLSTMPFPTCAAIHGACVGGGLELAMWCDYRVASNYQTKLGLPEVKLGLVPGWAGTVRLPRLCGLQAAVDLTTSARLVDGPQAYQLGLVSAVTEPDSLIEAAESQILGAQSTQSYLKHRQSMQGAVSDIGNLENCRSKCLQQITDRTEIFEHAPRLVLEHLLDSARLTHDEACQAESIAMSKVYGSPISRGLLNHYFLGEHNRKQPGFVDMSIKAHSLQRIGIVGAGIMGCGISKACSDRGMTVTLLDISKDVLQRADQYLNSDRVTTTSDYSQLADCELVIEAVVESLPVKQQVLQQIEQAVSDEAIIATNTSAIPLQSMVDSIDQQKRFCGIHFCHPQVMSLIEVIRGETTSEQTIATAVEWVRSLRKMPIVVKDSPGFVVNRLLTIMLDQSLRLAEQGHTINEIDQALVEFGFQGGPFEIMDVIGTDTCMLAGRAMWNSGIRSLTPSPVLPKMVKQGWLGRKSLNGFYRYDKIDSPKQPNPAADQLIIEYQTSNRPIPLADIAPMIMSAIILEATNILQHQIVADARDIDLCIIHGLSFPAHLGGILFWANQFGIEQINSYLDQMASELPKRAPNEMLRQMASQATPFYS